MAYRIAVLISGKGSNLEAIARAIEAGRCNAEICVVVSDKKKAGGLDIARRLGVPTEVVRLKDQPDRPAWDRALADALSRHEPDLVVSAGFMKILGVEAIQRFHKRIINIHPSLLPLFPGMHGPREALEAGVRVSGCTVHVVDSGTDTGPIVGQAVVPVLADDDVESLHQRIHSVEHRLLPDIIDALSTGRIRIAPELSYEGGGMESSALFSPPLGDGTP